MEKEIEKEKSKSLIQDEQIKSRLKEKIKYYATSSLYSGDRNKRSAHRINIELDVYCTPYINVLNDEPLTILTKSINLSTKGICLKANDEILEKVNPDEFLLVSFVFEEEKVTFLCKCRSSNNHKLGIQFIRVIDNSTYNLNPTGYITNQLSRFIIGYELRHHYNSKIQDYKKYIL